MSCESFANCLQVATKSGILSRSWLTCSSTATNCVCKCRMVVEWWRRRRGAGGLREEEESVPPQPLPSPSLFFHNPSQRRELENLLDSLTSLKTYQEQLILPFLCLSPFPSYFLPLSLSLSLPSLLFFFMIPGTKLRQLTPPTHLLEHFSGAVRCPNERLVVVERQLLC